MNQASAQNPKTDFNRRILVVDDNQAIHEDFRKIFCGSSGSGSDLDATESALFGDTTVRSRAATFELDFASQGEEALHRVREAIEAGRPYALAFMDVRMPPGWDGIETTARIWEVDPHLQVVFCTAYSDYSLEKMSSRLRHSGDFVILKKPFDIVEVSQLATAFAGKWNLNRSVQERTHHLQETEKALRQSQVDLEKRVLERTEELAETQTRLEYLLRSSPAVVYCMKPGGRELTFISDNVTNVLGYEPKEFLSGSQFWTDRLHPEDLSRATSHRAQIQEKVLPPMEYRFRHKDGSYHWIHDDARVVRDAGGVPVEIIGSCIDITMLKQAEQERQLMEVQLRQAHKLEAVGQLAAGIAHEINTPIQYVGDNTRFLKDSFLNIEQVLQSHKEFLDAAKANVVTPELVARAEKVLTESDLQYLFTQIPSAIKETLEGVERVAKIVRAMKEFSHPGGKEKATADLNKAIETTVTVARNEWKYVAEIKLDLDPQLPAIPCFIGEFNQAILNLIVNAAHAIGDVVKQNPGSKGTITVSSRLDGDWIEVRVGDTGTGISEANRARIFEPFFTTKDVGKGTGQGLSIVYGSIVKRHGGTVNFETAPGQGTTFILRLPVTPPKPESGSRKTDKVVSAQFDTKFRTDFTAPRTAPQPT